MATYEDYIERIKKRVTKLMYENRKVFSIVEDIFLVAEHYNIPEKDLEFYVRETISSRLGLSYIVRNKCRGVDEITYTLNNIGGDKQDIRDEIENALIRSIMAEYLVIFPDNEVRKMFNAII